MKTLMLSLTAIPNIVLQHFEGRPDVRDPRVPVDYDSRLK